MHFRLHLIVQCAEKVVFVRLPWVLRKGGTGGDGWGHQTYLQGDMYMVAVVTGCRNGLVGTGWANSCRTTFRRKLTTLPTLHKFYRTNYVTWKYKPGPKPGCCLGASPQEGGQWAYNSYLTKFTRAVVTNAVGLC